jgi:hypothetical protein
VFVPAASSSKIIVAPGFPVPNHHFHADVMVCEGRYPLAADALDHEPSMVQAIAVNDDATAKEDAHPLTRQEVGVQIVVPETVVGNECEHLGAQAKIDIHRQMAAEG